MWHHTNLNSESKNMKIDENRNKKEKKSSLLSLALT